MSTPVPLTLLNKKSLTERLGVSTRTVENLVAAGQFPPGVRIGRFVYWSETVVEAWQKRLFAVQEGWRP